MLNRSRIPSALKRLERQFRPYNEITVSRAALLNNLAVFTELSGLGPMPVLKGNAYGHGIAEVATALASRNLPYMAVDGYFEALRIRQVSQQPVLIMGAIRPENFAHLRYDRFAFVAQDEATVAALGRTGRHLKVHLECNTGMNRCGVSPDDVTALTQRILAFKNLDLEGVMTHLADSDGSDPRTITDAVTKFDQCVESVRACGAAPSLLHVAQSAGSMRARSKYANAIRLGIGLYGINPFPPGHPLRQTLAPRLQPALKLASTIIKITALAPGDQVSYNYTFTASKKMTIGVLPLGYYEGVSRSLSGCGTVKVGAVQAGIIGRVCMNHTLIDLSGTDAKVGDPVTVISDKAQDANALDNIADKFGLFNYNLLTALSPDVRRRLVD